MMEPQGVERAQQNLQFIRETLEAAGQFTAVPGKSLMAAGVCALAGVASNAMITGAPWSEGISPQRALDTWGIVLALSLAIVSFGIHRKIQALDIRIQAPLIRKLLWSLCPALFIGAVLTSLAVSELHFRWLPAIWLGCYGAAVISGGQVSVAPVRYMGLCLLLAGAGAAASPPDMGLAWIAVGFGWVHIVFGAYIAWRHNG
jgi:hypothetical protein